MGATQGRVALLLGVNECTVNNWEKNRTSPDLHLIPRLIGFLGYSPPNGTPKTQGEAIVRYRQARGMRQEELARALGIDPSTLGRWERGASRPSERLMAKIRKSRVWREELNTVLEPDGLESVIGPRGSPR